MAVLVALCTLALAALVVWVLSGPLRRAGVIGRRRADHTDGAGAPGSLQVQAAPAPLDADPGERAGLGGERGAAELEAAREVTYREIRDAELDYRTGKLSERDYRAIDTELRAQALELLDEMERREGQREQD